MNRFRTYFLACAVCLSCLSVPALSAQEDSLNTAAGQETPKHWEFTLEDVIILAQSKSLSALVAKYYFISSYWQYRSYKAQFLPSLNLGAELGQYNRSIVALQDAETGETHYVQNDNMNNSLQLSIDQNIPFTGGTISLNTYLNRFDQFSPYGAMTYNSNPVNIAYYQPIFQYNRLKWEKKTEPKPVSYPNLRAHETKANLVCRLLLVNRAFYFIAFGRLMELINLVFQNM